MMTAELRNHCNRTEVLACLLAKAAGLAEEEIRSLAFAAKYHDIGKLMIPEVILDKPGRLTEEIGRASCRERGEIREGDGCRETKSERRCHSVADQYRVQW